MNTTIKIRITYLKRDAYGRSIPHAKTYWGEKGMEQSTKDLQMILSHAKENGISDVVRKIYEIYKEEV